MDSAVHWDNKQRCDAQGRWGGRLVHAGYGLGCSSFHCSFLHQPYVYAYVVLPASFPPPPPMVFGVQGYKVTIQSALRQLDMRQARWDPFSLGASLVPSVLRAGVFFLDVSVRGDGVSTGRAPRSWTLSNPNSARTACSTPSRGGKGKGIPGGALARRAPAGHLF